MPDANPPLAPTPAPRPEGGAGAATPVGPASGAPASVPDPRPARPAPPPVPPVAPHPAAPASNPARPVAVLTVLLLVALVAGYVTLDRNAPGSSRGTVSASIVQMAPRVSGEVVEVMVADDSIVAAGQALFRIDPRPFELAVRQAEAALAETGQSLDASTASLAAAQAAVTQADAALETARAEAARTQRLEERGVVAKARGETARNALSQAEGQAEAARASLESARAQLGPEGRDNPAIAAAEAQLARAQYDLASATVLAPHLGVVTNLTLSPGQYASAGSPALTFIDAAAAWVTVDLRENQLGNVSAGDAALILFDSRPGEVFDGRVQSVAWGINPGRSAQGGLVVNQSSNRWFEPARHIPFRVELAGGMDGWPDHVPVGGKATVTILARPGGVTEAFARAVMRVRAFTSYLH